MTSEYQLHRYRRIKERNKCVVFDDHGLYSGPLPPKPKRAIDVLPFMELMSPNKIRWIQREVRRIDHWLFAIEMRPITDWNKKLEARNNMNEWLTDVRQKMQIVRTELQDIADRHSVRMMSQTLEDIQINLTLIQSEFNTLVDTSLRAAYRELKGVLRS